MDLVKSLVPVLAVIVGSLLTTLTTALNRRAARKDLIFQNKLTLSKAVVAEIASLNLGKQDLAATRRSILQIVQRDYLFFSDMTYTEDLVEFLSADDEVSPERADGIVTKIKKECGL